jgi:hypothetical protein
MEKLLHKFVEVLRRNILLGFSFVALCASVVTFKSFSLLRHLVRIFEQGIGTSDGLVSHIKLQDNTENRGHPSKPVARSEPASVSGRAIPNV